MVGASVPRASAALPPGLVGALIDLSEDAVILLDAEGRATSWNITAERLFGYTPGEIVGRPLTVLIAAHSTNDVADVVDRVLSGDHVRRFETTGLRRDGMPVPVSVSASAVCSDPGGRQIGIVIVRDLTEQRLAQAALAEVETRLRESEALAGVGSWLWDVGSGALQWSDEAHRLHGVDPLDFDGTFESHLALIHDADRRRVRTAMEASVASGRPFDQEYRIERPDGEVRFVRARAQPTFGAVDAVLGLRGVVQDVTDRLGDVTSSAGDG